MQILRFSVRSKWPLPRPFIISDPSAVWLEKQNRNEEKLIEIAVQTFLENVCQLFERGYAADRSNRGSANVHILDNRIRPY